MSFFSLYQHYDKISYVFIDYQEVFSGKRCGPWASCFKMKSDSFDQYAWQLIKMLPLEGISHLIILKFPHDV